MIISTDNGVIRNRFGDLEAARMIREAGFDGVDYTFYGMKPENDILALPDDRRYALACQVREYAEKAGLSFPQTHAPFILQKDELPFIKTHAGKGYDDIVRSMEFAHWLGAKSIVIHTLRCPRRDYTLDDWEENYAFMRSFLPYADQYGLQIGVENLITYDKKLQHYVGYRSDPREMKRFIAYLDDPHFEVCCDLGHAAICGTDPEVFIANMDAKMLTMLHVQDTDFLGDRHFLPYQGQHDWEAVTQALADIGYTGAMNLEVLHFYDRFPPELTMASLRMAAETARRLAAMVEEKKAGKAQ